MTPSLMASDSLLVVDVGTVHTRAALFDVVEGRYRFLARGVSRSTAGAPYHDVGEGVRRAVDDLQTVTGRVLVGPDERLIIPSAADGSGVDAFAATLSAGPPIKVLAIGLLEEVSLESARRLAMTTYARVMDVISLNDRRKTEARIDTITSLRPDLIIAAGGTEGGASQSVLKLLEPVGLAAYLIPENQRPAMLFSGNQDLHDEINGSLGGLTQISFAPNIRPTLEAERLDAAQVQMVDIFRHIRARQMPGVGELDTWAGGGLMPSASAFGRLVRFLSKAYASTKGVLGVDIGAAATSIAAGFGGQLTQGVYPNLGLGSGLPGMLETVQAEAILRWIPGEVSEKSLREYIYNKALYPDSIPATAEELLIEQALARQALSQAVRLVSESFPPAAFSPAVGLLPAFEPILASGSVLVQAPSPAHSLLMLLDGLQPTGVTTIVLDQNHLASALGAAAAINPVLTVQVLDSTTFLYLGTVISPVGHARPGTPILRVKMKYDSGHETALDVKQGALEVLPLPLGQTARLQLQPLHRFDAGLGGPGRSGHLNVHGGVLGVVIDARGRPLTLSDEPGRRAELYKKWLWTLGG